MKSMRMLSLCIGLALTAGAAQAQVVFSETDRRIAGRDAASITPARDAFRGDLGGGSVAGSDGLFSNATGARREINWDDVASLATSPNPIWADYYRSRGVILSQPFGGAGYRVSANQFNEINPDYSKAFEPFSGNNMFSPIGSSYYWYGQGPVMDVSFVVPGTNTPAVTKGFGAIFSDVDVAGSTRMEYFGVGGSLLGTYTAPNVPTNEVTVGSETFSFIGVSFHDALISRVRIYLGSQALSANNVGFDLVALDDFVYGEPILTTAVIPEPSTHAMILAGLLAFGAMLRRRTA